MVSWRHSNWKNQEAKRVRDIGSLIFDTPIQHDYEAGVEVLSLLPTERLEEMDGRLAVTDAETRGVRYVKFWVDGAPSSPADGGASFVGEEAPIRASYPHAATPPFPNLSAGDDFGGGVRFDDDDAYERGHIPESVRSHTRTPQTSQIPPEDNVPRACSLHSMEPLREWFCKGADMTSRARSVPKGGVGVTSSMIVLEPEAGGSNLVAHVVVPVSDEYYAMMDSGTNAIIVPLHPDMSGEIAERKVPSRLAPHCASAQVSIFATIDHCSTSVSNSYLPRMLTTVARWTIIAESKDGVSQIEVYTSTRGPSRGSPKTLSMKNGLPYFLRSCSGKLWRTLLVKPPWFLDTRGRSLAATRIHVKDLRVLSCSVSQAMGDVRRPYKAFLIFQTMPG